MESEEKHEFRALYLEKEFDEVRDLLVSVPDFNGYYPDFGKWLDKALKEALKGERLVYALYEAVLRSGRPQLKINSVAIVKIAGESAELKCLFVHEGMNSNGSGKLLYERVEEQLTKKGISKIITDVPYENKELNWFLIQNGFQINGFIERYKKGNFDYILSKDVPMCYTGDPFDWYRISEWFLEQIYQFKIETCEKQEEAFFRRYQLLVASHNSTSSPLPAIKGESVVYEGILQYENLEDILKCVDKVSSFGIVIAQEFEDICLEEFNEKNILAFNKKSIFEQCGCQEPIFDKEDIDGMIVEVKSEHFEKISPDDDFFTYVKGAGSGKFARKGNFILFLVDSHRGSPSDAIMGFGKIEEISCADPQTQWELYNNLNPIFLKDDYDQFTNYKKEVIAIVVSNFKRITPIPRDDFKSKFKEYFHNDNIGNVYVDEEFITSFLFDVSQQQNFTTDLLELESNDSGEDQFELLLESLAKIHDELRRKNDYDMTSFAQDLAEIKRHLEPGVKHSLLLSAGVNISGNGGVLQTEIPLKTAAYSNLSEDLKQLMDSKTVTQNESNTKSSIKLVDRILKSLLEIKIWNKN
ncbi:MAG: hypothetical protein SCH66_01535 [Methanolobus sp.]|nr:hypothetical protein [Methanolobus sp.]